MNILYQTLEDSFDEQLETEHLILRPYQDGDENDFIRLLQESASVLNPAFGGRLARVRVLDDARSQVRQLRTEWDNRKMFDFGVWLRKGYEYIGDIALKNLEHRVPKAEIGLYFTSWPDTRQLAIEGMHSVIEFAFETLKLNKLYMRCTSSNLCFGELAESCGFIKEGIFRDDFKGADSEELLDLVYYGMTRQDYERTKQKQEQASKPTMV
jgi:[ribosomal protein S5]-alanine N-acetyltransferase